MRNTILHKFAALQFNEETTNLASEPYLHQYSRLVADVFGKENKGRVPMDKVMMLIWQCHYWLI